MEKETKCPICGEKRPLVFQHVISKDVANFNVDFYHASCICCSYEDNIYLKVDDVIPEVFEIYSILHE